jgi:hypothetical protein
MEVAEDAALRCEAIEIRSDEAFRAEYANVSVALIVGEDDDDVGELGAGGGESGSGEDKEREQHRREQDGLHGLNGR